MPEKPKAFLELAGVTKVFTSSGKPVRALDNLALTVRPGELLVLLGPSGCGKTTLLRSIAGLETLTAGRILLEGREIQESSPGARDVSMVFQQPALYPHMTVLENISFPGKLRGLSKAARSKTTAETAQLAGISDLLGRKPETLSGGQQQRVSLARALSVRPKVLLLDEPFANLDPWARAAVRRELRRVQRRTSITTVCVTHDQVDAFAVGDRIALMREGAIIETGDPEGIWAQPQNLFAAAFLGSTPMNFFWVRVGHEKVDVLGTIPVEDILATSRLNVPATQPAASFPADPKRLPKARNEPLVLGIRPEHLAICDAEAGAWMVRVDSVEPTGSERVLACSWDGGALALRVSRTVEVPSGPEMWVKPDLGQAHWFCAESGRRVAAGT